MSTNELKSLTEIFSNRFYRIPDYQRGYAWEDPQLKDFWDDLLRVIDKPDSIIHYTGMLTVEKIDSSKVCNDSAWEDEKPYFTQKLEAYYVVDGQQRLTTSIVLISVLLNSIQNEKILYEDKSHWQNLFLYKNFEQYQSYRFGYIKDMPSYEFFKTNILGQNSMHAANVAADTLYTRNLKNAKSFFEKVIKECGLDLEIVFSKLISAFKFNFYEIGNNLDVFVAFETMNNRGKKLSDLELLKNRLIYLSTILNDEQLRKSINAAWGTVYKFLGEDSSRKLVDDDFLRDHWIMYFPEYNREGAKAYSTFLLGEYFTTKSADSKKITSVDISDYVASIQSSIKHWYQMFNPRYMGKEFQASQTELVRLNHLSFSTFHPLIMAAFSKNPNDEELAGLLKQIERFVFLVFLISRRRTNTQNSQFFRIAYECFKGKNKVSGLAEEIKIITNKWLKTSDFKSYIDDLFERGENGYYKWNGLKYFLFEYESSLIPVTNGVAKVRLEEYISRELKDSVEHIFPQEPENKDWPHFERFDDVQLNRLKNSLGNLLILSVSSNASASKHSFKKKCNRLNSKSQTVGYANGSYSEIKVSLDYQDWDSESILKRGLLLLNFLGNKWDVELGNDKEKMNLLGLTFLSKILT